MPSAVVESKSETAGDERYVHTRASDNDTPDILIDDMNRSNAGSFGVAVAKVIQALPLRPVPDAKSHLGTYDLEQT